jgi:histone H3/H4
MQIVKPVRKRKRGVGTEAQGTEAQSTEAQSTEAPGTEAPAPESTAAPTAPESTEASTRGLLRKSAIRRFLKKEFDFPLQIREAFFAAAEARFSEDLRRSVARAREFKRNTLMGPDA